jgi:hypothetical protein
MDEGRFVTIPAVCAAFVTAAFIALTAGRSNRDHPQGI